MLTVLAKSYHAFPHAIAFGRQFRAHYKGKIHLKFAVVDEQLYKSIAGRAARVYYFLPSIAYLIQKIAAYHQYQSWLKTKAATILSNCVGQNKSNTPVLDGKYSCKKFGLLFHERSVEKCSVAASKRAWPPY